MPDPKVPERYHPTPEESKLVYDNLRFPHCDPSILHKPGDCKYCDAHPDWQALRIAWEINFTGEDNLQKAPCPSSKYRPAYQAHRWGGNHPTNAVVPLQAPTSWEHLEDDGPLDE